MEKARIHGYDVVFESTGSGVSCHAPGLPGCVSAGATRTECKRRMEAAIELHLDGLREDGLPLPSRDGRGEPRPARRKGRTASIPSRVTSEAADALAAISKREGLTKTEALERIILQYRGRSAS